MWKRLLMEGRSEEQVTITTRKREEGLVFCNVNKR
jgi:hypothetical protein